MKISSTPLLLTIAIVTTSPVFGQGQVNTKTGAALGGLAGALTGAAIGDHNNEAGAGALIGGAIGLITGATLGSAEDRRVADQQAYAQQQVMQRISRAVSPVDVVSMTQNGLSDPVIINHIHHNGVQQRLQVGDVIALHKQGVSDHVIDAMQKARLASAPVVVPRVYAPSPPPVVIRERHYVTPVFAPRPYYHHPHHYHHRRHHAPRSSFHWGIHIGH